MALVVPVSELPSPYERVTITPASGGVPKAPESTVTTKEAGSVAMGVSGSTVPPMDEENLPISMVFIASEGRYCALPAFKWLLLWWRIL